MKRVLHQGILWCTLLFNSSLLIGQNVFNNPRSNHGNRFEQIGPLLEDVNEYRAASGAPGHAYWQQKADYKITAVLDEQRRVLHGSETITYTNNSPDVLNYLWLQLDENEHNPKGENNYFNESKLSEPITPEQISDLDVQKRLNGYGTNIWSVTDAKGQKLPFTINHTMMRIDLPKGLKSKEKFVFNIRWSYKIAERMRIGGRGGYEFMPDGQSDLFTISQWYPRMCVYSDYQGWNHKQFTGRGEFSLVFGDFDVNIMVPSDHVVAATGECANYKEVLSAQQWNRWNSCFNQSESAIQTKKVNTPNQIVTLDDVNSNINSYLNILSSKGIKLNPSNVSVVFGDGKACLAGNSQLNIACAVDPNNKDQVNALDVYGLGYKTWKYSAKNVRDFAWGSSRKFTWDAMPEYVEGKKVMCMSYYPKESYKLYNKYSTKVVAHTIKTYSKYTIPYQYPVAISVEASSGMEYPMICFNYGRTDSAGNYTEATKYGMIGVIIHEVGHNFFPMIINSDERHWSWMDEGLNTFVQFLTEQEFDNNYPSRRGPAHKIVDYMKLPVERLEPIMTNSENIIEFGPNAYAKPATALNILRETVMGRELFDYAFKEYCRRWAYKHPRPSDFFRSMEDASGVDLDWFWRAWFFDIQPVDIRLDSVVAFKLNNPSSVPVKIDTLNTNEQLNIPRNRAARRAQAMEDDRFLHVSRLRNKAAGMVFAVDTDTALRDKYYYRALNSKGEIAEERIQQRDSSQKIQTVNRLSGYDVVSDVEFADYKNNYYYQLSLSNVGGTVMPVIIQWNYVDGTSEVDYISAYIWRKNEDKFTKAFVKYKEVQSIVIDPFRETADIDESNQRWEAFENPAQKGKGSKLGIKNLLKRK